MRRPAGISVTITGRSYGAAIDYGNWKTTRQTAPGQRFHIRKEYRVNYASESLCHELVPTNSMKHTSQIAKHLRDVHFGGNWTAVNLKDNLTDLTWQQATTHVGSPHTIAELVYHMNYYINDTIKVLRGGLLDASDKLSFDCPTISSEKDWERLLNKTWTEAEELATLIECLSDEQLAEDFVDGKYGTYYRCLQGLIEHCHYHLSLIHI